MNVIQKYCFNKDIAIIGNSSNLLNKKCGNHIDKYDVVVRINYGPLFIDKYYEFIGKKTDIISYGMTQLHTALQISNLRKPKFNLFPIRLDHNEIDYKKYNGFSNPVFSSREHYLELKSNFGNFKPSTGAATINYFLKNIDFKSLHLYGFDFFENESKTTRNPLGSYYYKDHNSYFEKKYIMSILRNDVKLHVL